MVYGEDAGMNTQQLLLRCFAQQDGSQWVAVCVDLNLAAQADTCKEAVTKLNRQMVCFVRDALSGDDRPYAAQLLNRKAPLDLLLRYHWIAFKQAIHTAHERCRSFLQPMPLVPAGA